jgi:hypothetical protein
MKPQVEAAGDRFSQLPSAVISTVDHPLGSPSSQSLKKLRVRSLNLVHEVMDQKVDAWHDVYYHCTIQGRMTNPAGKVVAHVLRLNPMVYSNPGLTCYNLHKLHYPGCTRDHDESDERCPFYNRSTAAATAVSAAGATPSVVPTASCTPIAEPSMDVDAPSAQANRQGVFNMHHMFINVCMT